MRAEKIPTQPVPPPPFNVTITMTSHEARILCGLIGSIGGDGVNSRLYITERSSGRSDVRPVTDALWHALKALAL